MRYVDGFLIPIPKKNLRTYTRMARLAGRIWMEHGALEYVECTGDDLAIKGGKTASFLRTLRTKPGQTVLFSWIAYRSRAHRDRVNAKVMKDPRMDRMMRKGEPMPFDVKRMNYGGFRSLVDL